MCSSDLTSPPKPAEAAILPLRDTATWWQPSLCAFDSDCANGNPSWALEWTWMVEEPEAERMALSVVAREKMSVIWASSSQSAPRSLANAVARRTRQRRGGTKTHRCPRYAW